MLGRSWADQRDGIRSIPSPAQHERISANRDAIGPHDRLGHSIRNERRELPARVTRIWRDPRADHEETLGLECVLHVTGRHEAFEERPRPKSAPSRYTPMESRGPRPT